MRRPPDQLRRFMKWFTPGIGVKRWLILMLVGAILLGVGVAFLAVEIYRLRPEYLWRYIVFLRTIPLWLLSFFTVSIGGCLILLGTYRINRNLLQPLDLEAPDLLDAVMDQRNLRRGPRIVAIGGGTGLPTLLRGLKAHTSNLTAIITVADDGGSSGKLRRDLGVLPPGDFRNNIVALARDEAMITQLFQYRFGEGGLDGHSFGNLFITAMSEITGSFERALIESSRVLSIRGQVLPSTLIDVSLIADLREYEAEGTRRVIGESLIPTVQGRIERVHLDPENPPAYPDAVKAILSADLIVLGPGSLYTSILPNLLVKGITDALRAALAPVVYICNVAQQAGETDGFSVQDHIRAIESHVGKSVVDIVIANSSFPKVEVLPGETPFTWVQMEQSNKQDPGYQIMEVQLADKQSPWRHDAVMLGKVLIGLLAAERTAL